MVGRLLNDAEKEVWSPYGPSYNDTGKLNIEVRPRDDRGRHLVVASFNGTAHKHRFDVDNQRDRREFREAVISRFCFGDDAHGAIEELLIAGAVNADSQPATVECTTVRLSDVQPEKVKWLWRERFAIGKLTLLVGDPGLGKSFVTLDIAARITNGSSWPDSPGTLQEPGDVILLGAEDDLADTIRPRLDAHDADVSRIIAIKGARYTDEEQDRMINLSTDLDSIRRVGKAANNPLALIIDPVSAYLGKTDSHKNAEVRAVLAPLADLAAELGVAVIAVSHLRKGEGQALYRTMGSLAFIAAARSAWVVCRDEITPTRRLMLPLKSNIAPDIGGLAFSIGPHPFNGQPCVQWEDMPVSVAADDALGSKPQKHGPDATERDEAMAWLREQLANGPRPAKELQADGVGCGITRRTLYRAFRDINGESKLHGFPAVAHWSIPGCATPGTTD